MPPLSSPSLTPIAGFRRDERPRVLLAEGDSITAHVLRHRLERDGTAVETSADGPSTIELLRAETYHAVVLDADLIGIDGLDVLRRVRVGVAGRPDLPVMVLTWPGNDGQAARAYHLDADVVVSRPLSLTTVSAGVRRLTRRLQG